MSTPYSHHRNRCLDLVAVADHLSTILVEHSPDLTRVEPSKQHHGRKHQASIEDV